MKFIKKTLFCKNTSALRAHSFGNLLKSFENAIFEFENIQVDSFPIDGWLVSKHINSLKK